MPIDQLKVLWRELVGAEINFDLEVTGFETAEIDLLVDGPTDAERIDRSDILPAPQTDAVSRLGDLWHLGDHLLLCGNACDAASYAELLADEPARLVFTDPPYNVPIDGHVGGLGAIKHREFKMASGEMTAAEFEHFLKSVFKNLASASVDGALHFICMDWRHMAEVMSAASGIYSELKNLCVWNKNNGGMGSLYRSKHELVFVYKAGTAPHLNTIELGKHGRYRTNVWDYAGVNTFRTGREAELEMHPTVKPTALVIDAIKDCSRRGEIVLDMFAGSGTTIMAAHKSRRRARAIELDPPLCRRRDPPLAILHGASRKDGYHRRDVCGSRRTTQRPAAVANRNRKKPLQRLRYLALWLDRHREIKYTERASQERRIGSFFRDFA
jgi:DNA modification methylase